MSKKHSEDAYYRELIAWVGRHIKTRTASMATATKFCRLCSSGTKLRRVDCRHEEIWKITAVEPDPAGSEF